ncbi:MAG: radical SAM protein [Deltaproteobacteria bacterium]|nr:radical SAM protein [Deltaproteobacteria bacterium]
MLPADIKRLHLDLTNNCNIKCPFCSRTKYLPHLDKKKPVDMDWCLISKRIKQIAGQLIHVSLCGTFGEPTLHPLILNIIQWFREHTTAKLSIDTNGTTHNAAWWHKLATLGVHVCFSIDGTSSENYTKYRVGADLNTVMSHMTSFIDGGGKAEWQFIVFKSNEHEIETAKTLARTLGCKIIFKTSRNYKNSFSKPLEFNPLNNKCNTCKFVHRKELYIAHDRQVEFCCRYQPRYSDTTLEPKIEKLYLSQLALFDLKHHELQDVLRTPYFEFMEKFYFKFCKKYHLGNDSELIT